MSKVQSKVWFITGTSKGFGKAIVEAVLASGQRAVATARKPEDLDYLKEKYPSSQLLIKKLDVTSQEEIKSVFADVKEHFGRLDVVVNNAGYAVFGEVEGTPDQDARREFEVQFWGPVNISKEAVKIFRDVNPEGQGGIFFNFSSAGGYSGNPCLAFYSASKFALEGFTESFQKEFLPEWNIKSCIIEPGGYDSTGWRGESMTFLPQHPAYANPKGATSIFRAMVDTVPYIGVKERLAQALLKLAEEPELPLRIQLGSDSVAIVKYKARKTIEDADKWAEISHSTNMDGIDAEAYMEQILITIT